MPKPVWLSGGMLAGSAATTVNSALRKGLLNTVCEESFCPNRGECWGNGTATFLLMGKVCTRNCLFCGVKSGKQGEELDAREPEKVGASAKELGLEYVVLTSVDRDDLEDGGAGHFAECIKEVKKLGVRVEVLIPDFQGRLDCLEKIVSAKPDVLGHNIEVVERLQAKARDSRASYANSLELLHNIKVLDAGIVSKSGIMLGLGESLEEVEQAMGDLLEAGCDLLTLGQYLQPAKGKLPVYEYVAPAVFEELRKIGLEKGFKGVAAGPLVRSSYKAGDLFEGAGNL